MGLIQREWESLKIAVGGLFTSLRETHVRMHVMFGIIFTVIGFFAELSPIEWMAQSICISVLIAAEIFNTAIEKLCDLISIERKPEIKFIKDIAAGAVFMTSIAAFVCGGIIYFPRIQDLL